MFPKNDPFRMSALVDLQYFQLTLFEAAEYTAEHLNMILRDNSRFSNRSIELLFDFFQLKYTQKVQRNNKIMARYKTRNTNEWSFANVRLTNDQRDEFTSWSSTAVDDLFELMLTVILEGYKISVSFDGKNGSWIASLTGQEDAPQNSKTTMSARHSDMELAMALVIFKHTVVCERGVWQDKSESFDWG